MRSRGFDCAARGGGGIVDLVGKPGRKGAEGDQGAALPGGDSIGPGGAVQPCDQVPPEREPGVGQRSQASSPAPGAPAGGALRGRSAR